MIARDQDHTWWPESNLKYQEYHVADTYTAAEATAAAAERVVAAAKRLKEMRFAKNASICLANTYAHSSPINDLPSISEACQVASFVACMNSSSSNFDMEFLLGKCTHIENIENYCNKRPQYHLGVFIARLLHIFHRFNSIRVFFLSFTYGLFSRILFAFGLFGL